MGQKCISVVLVEDHSVLRDGLAHLLKAEPDMDIVGSLACPKELVKCLGHIQADVVVLGLLFPGDDGLRCIADFSKAYPQTNLLVLSQLSEETYAQRVLNAGARGYLMKTVTTDVLLAAIRTVANGEVAVSSRVSSRLLSCFASKSELDDRDGMDRLTDRELHVLTLIGQGHTNAAVASSMGISKKTVDSFKERIKAKLSLQNSTQLAQVAVQHLERVQ